MTHEPSKMGAKAIGKIKAAGKALKGESGILRHLADEHGQVDGLMKRVSGSTDPKVREELFPEIRKHLLSHAQAEEAEFYPALRGIGLDALVERSLDQHREVESMLERLHSDEKSAPGWMTLFERMKEAVEEHVQLEENEVFPKASEAIDSDQLKQMLDQYERTEETVKAQLR